jgi:hypothetical protein
VTLAVKKKLWLQLLKTSKSTYQNLLIFRFRLPHWWNPIAWYIEKPVIEPVKFVWMVRYLQVCPLPILIIYFSTTWSWYTYRMFRSYYARTYSIIKLWNSFFHGWISFGSFRKGEEDYQRSNRKALNGKTPEAIVIRTLQMKFLKKSRYSHSNPPYLEEAAIHSRMRYSAFINRFAKCR